MQISFSPPDVGELEIENIIRVINSGWLTTGPKTKEFERRIATYCETEKAVCLNSATACLELTLRILGVGVGDEVITSAYTYTASASVIEHVGAKVVLVDTAKDSFFMNYLSLENAITKKTKAIIAVDIAGIPCDYEKLFNIVNCKKNLFQASNYLQDTIGRVAVIADAAHSFGAIYKKKKVGSVADFTCFSFHAVKNLTTSEGGAATWRSMEGLDNEWLYREYMLWSLHGQNKDALSKTQLGSWEYEIDRLGYKCNMTDIMAAIGVAQLDRYEAMLSRRKQIINAFQDGLRDCNIVMLNHADCNYISSGHLFLTRVLGINENTRNALIVKMAEAGIATNVHYKPLPMHGAYKQIGFDIQNYQNSYVQYQNEITLPLHTQLSNDEVEYIIDTYKTVLRSI